MRDSKSGLDFCMKEKALESCAEIVSEGFTYDHTVILQCDNSN